MRYAMLALIAVVLLSTPTSSPARPTDSGRCGGDPQPTLGRDNCHIKCGLCETAVCTYTGSCPVMCMPIANCVPPVETASAPGG